MADTVSPTKNYASILSKTGSDIGTSNSPNVTTSLALGATNQAEFYVKYTQDSLTLINIIVEVSPDNVNWFQKSLLNIAGGSASSLNYSIPMYAALYTMNATGSLVIDLPVAHGWMRLRVWGTGTPASDDSIEIWYGGGAI